MGALTRSNLLATTNLLLVEDDEAVRSALTRVLNRTGFFAVIPAENGQRALEILGAEPVDAILTDLQMPVMDGLTLLSHLLERGTRIPVAVMTGQRITPELGERLHHHGIAATFSKPVDISVLADELQRSLTPATVGRITGVTLFGFLQLLEVERKTALIVVHAAGREGRLYFDRGKLVHGEAGARSGIGVVYEILGWPDPRLDIFHKRTPRERTIAEPLQHILMEAARLLDERGRTNSVAAEVEDADDVAAVGRCSPSVTEALEEAMRIDGALAVALVDGASGMTLGMAGGSAALNVELAAAGAADFIRAKQRVIGTLGLRDAIEDVMITLGKQYHLIRFLGPELGVFLYLVLERERSNLGMGRHKLAALARRITL